MRYFTFSFLTKFLKPTVYFILTTHLNSDAKFSLEVPDLNLISYLHLKNNFAHLNYYEDTLKKSFYWIKHQFSLSVILARFLLFNSHHIG